MKLIINSVNRLINTTTSMRFVPADRAWLPVHPDEPVNGRSVTLQEAVLWLQTESGHPCKVPVAVIGGRSAEPFQLEAAEEAGRIIGSMRLTLLCGGRQGIMEAACKGASGAGGLTVGLLPDESPEMANPYVDIPIATGIGVARNALLTRAALCLAAVGGGYGTISEIAFGLQFEKPVFALADPPEVHGVVRCSNAQELGDNIAKTVLNLPS